MRRRHFLTFLSALPLVPSLIPSGALGGSHVPPQEVAIKGFKFDPETIEVTMGHDVIWSNQDGARHSATADAGSFDTGIMKRRKSGQIKFAERGTYPYHCKVHPRMKGTVVVN